MTASLTTKRVREPLGTWGIVRAMVCDNHKEVHKLASGLTRRESIVVLKFLTRAVPK